MGQDPLSQLRDIHIPEAGGFWPPAPGWWMVAALLLLVVVIAGYLLHRRRRKLAWVRQARRELRELSARAESSQQWFSELNRLLKRVACHQHPERAPQNLSGEDWISFLLETSPRDRIAYRPIVEAMVASVWQPEVIGQPTQAVEFTRQWLRGQR